MEAEARYTWVGAIVLALLAALVGGLLWLRDAGNRADFRQYAIYFERQALDGLQVGADVSLRGIRVGRVQDYALSGEKINRVRVEVRVDRRTPVYDNTTAVVTRNFVTGIAAITLVTGDPPGKPLESAADGDRLPLIAEGRSELDEIAGRVNQAGQQASLALANLNQLIDADNRREMVDTVRSLRLLAQGLNERLGTLDRTMVQVGQAATRIGAAAADAGAAAAQLGAAGERVAGVVERGGTQLATTLAEGDRTLAETRRAVERIGAAGDAVQQRAALAATRIEASAAHLDDQLSAAVSELRLSAESAARALDRLREPRSALLGPSPAQLGPGEKLP